MLVYDIRVEGAVPAGLEANVRVVDRFEIELIEWTWCPDVGAVGVDHFGDGVVDIDIEDVPLRLSAI